MQARAWPRGRGAAKRSRRCWFLDCLEMRHRQPVTLLGSLTRSSHSRYSSGAAVQGVLELGLDHARGLARVAEFVVVDLADRHQLGRGAVQEDLLGEVELRARDVALDDRVAEVAGDLDHRFAVDPVKDRRGVTGRDELALAEEEDVLARSLADEAALVEQDRLVEAGVALSVLARIEFRYWPEAFAWGIRPAGEIRRQEETLARMPFACPPRPRYAPQGQTAMITSTGALCA